MRVCAVQASDSGGSLLLLLGRRLGERVAFCKVQLSSSIVPCRALSRSLAVHTRLAKQERCLARARPALGLCPTAAVKACAGSSRSQAPVARGLEPHGNVPPPLQQAGLARCLPWWGRAGLVSRSTWAARLNPRARARWELGTTVQGAGGCSGDGRSAGL